METLQKVAEWVARICVVCLIISTVGFCVYENTRALRPTEVAYAEIEAIFGGDYDLRDNFGYSTLGLADKFRPLSAMGAHIESALMACSNMDVDGGSAPFCVQIRVHDDGTVTTASWVESMVVIEDGGPTLHVTPQKKQGDAKAIAMFVKSMLNKPRQ